MAEYINREELLKDINDTVVFSTRNGVSAELRGAHKIVDRIRSAPACDVVEVVHGEWEEVKYIEGCLASYKHTCNCCGKSYFDNNSNNYPFCPLCGAKMDGERKSDDG